jgi:hypothetical protein
MSSEKVNKSKPEEPKIGYLRVDEVLLTGLLTVD